MVHSTASSVELPGIVVDMQRHNHCILMGCSTRFARLFERFTKHG